MHNLQKTKLKIYAHPAVPKKKDYFFSGFRRFSVLLVFAIFRTLFP